MSARVYTHAYGAATLRREYHHRDEREVVWDVKADTGEIFHLSQRYVDGLRRIDTPQETVV